MNYNHPNINVRPSTALSKFQDNTFGSGNQSGKERSLNPQTRRDKLQHNYGIDVLRIWMCFEVILNHFWNFKPSDPNLSDGLYLFLYTIKGVAVTCFIFLSFLLCSKVLNTPNLSKKELGNRLKRIIIPIVFWAIVYYVALNALSLLGGHGLNLSIKDLTLQLILGHAYNTPMWFMNDLLLLTITTVLINRIVPRKHWITTNILITITALLFCISGLNYQCFGGLGYALRYPLGRYFEMLPYMGLANILYLTGAAASLFRGNHRNLWIGIFAIACIALVIIMSIKGPSSDSFGYGAPLQYLLTIPLTLLFIILPFDKVNAKIRNSFKYIAHYTLGIYCVHIFIGNCCNSLLLHFGLNTNTLLECLIIFLLGFIFCRILAFIPLRWIKQSVS